MLLYIHMHFKWVGYIATVYDYGTFRNRVIKLNQLFPWFVSMAPNCLDIKRTEVCTENTYSAQIGFKI